MGDCESQKVNMVIHLHRLEKSKYRYHILGITIYNIGWLTDIGEVTGTEKSVTLAFWLKN